MDETAALIRAIVVTAGKAVTVAVAVILCLVGGAVSLNAHNDALLVAAGACAIAALFITVAGSLWVLRSIRALSPGKGRRR